MTPCLLAAADSDSMRPVPPTASVLQGSGQGSQRACRSPTAARGQTVSCPCLSCLSCLSCQGRRQGGTRKPRAATVHMHSASPACLSVSRLRIVALWP